MAGCDSIEVTVSINGNADSLLRRNNFDMVSFTNTIRGLGRTNALQKSVGGFTSGGSGSFTDLFFVTNTTGLPTNYLDPGALTNASAAFYRVRIVP